MPELPEVETTRRGIAPTVEGRELRRLIVREHRLRWPVPADLPALVEGRRVLATGRRGKYLLMQFEHGWLIVHLGMSGSLRHVHPDEAPRKHDHVDWVFDQAALRLHDPRRFGAVLWHAAASGPVENHPLLASLGIEPFDDRFDGGWLFRHTRRRSAPIKQALLMGDIVVGVGNIYASESLFRAGIHPRTAAGRISAARYDKLAAAVRATLDDAIRAGGSSLRDYVGAGGESGYFQIDARVYDRAGLPCRVCETPIRRLVQGQRATYYCPKCQR
ncbi:bifunctional DNA-formamidopyrimidine glycosylase/DNA-(apurinic or apyrimidinic site) lyase [Pigmentiphaga sp.]|uniref:bifunctional DNA-formamidopyrimidine glycosylase/DNA-(apurinic or apyrimidinic site) lyase n=1 Tax=Pigmentiphaga sp. TaxID=1977564 RepID=UPI00128E2C19|nr:bifunctional DNA-formamidopyrimidine glycosylase/DNA-(apurinic or apyrimidinic site) lyase [Pigmentiphaga sp.]MPS27628.1 bifunctional DNA-formamidopyrimidine glycosylase/DNA-(apurinic or apyrimidinic site) lyase [Alcaligenaceae bacterium SAGV5]MPS50655.1 bifunctional DNA-formamidopyrimidine glycosylase/DNA-(apurinic or apyrimidinic site) lyase [Alcaligenaceae bacterium SAGV3]MPT56094.1 bifunctional DNA-formamidopyrimidine glycosylase/DNA-(apurinic or apyrimidinic site) lyase [Alcaligenaceae b